MTINNKTINIGGKFDIGNNKPFFLMAGPCVIESKDHTLKMAEEIKKITDRLGINYVFKSCYDKANRSSSSSYRGLSIEEGLRIMEDVKKELDVPLITDFHHAKDAKMVGEVVDIIQVPAFLSRQTDIIKVAAETGLPIHVKKMQQLAPWVLEHTVKKAKDFGNDKVILCDRGTMFGYGSLVNDMRGLPIMAQYAPVTIDCTHSCQLPCGKTTAGNRDMAQVIASGAVAIGVSGVFAEVHDNPEKARCDSANMMRLDKLEGVLKRLMLLDKIAKEYPLDIKNYTILG